jgi:hypothetical protein
MATNLPDVTITIQDGALGQVPASVATASVKLGICSDGVVGQLYSFGDTTNLSSSLGVGPLVEAVGATLSMAGGPVYAMPLNPTTLGSAGSVTHTGPGTGTVTVSLAPKQAIQIKIVLGGVNGTATFQIALGGGAYGAVIPTTGGTFNYLVPGTLTQITLAAAQTWVANDVYTVATDGTVTLSGSGPVASNVTHTDSPLDAYSPLVTMVTGGAVGTAVFTLSLDGGNNIGPSIATATKYAIPGTGVVLNFSGTFTAADTYAFTTTTAAFSNTDVTNGFTTLLAQATEWGFAHLVGMGANSAAAAATAAVLDTQMTTAETAYRFVFAVLECPTSEIDSTVITSFSSFTSRRVMVCAGDIRHVSPLTGRVLRRNCAFVVSSRLAAIQPGEDAAWVGSPIGAVSQIQPATTSTSGLYRDEAKTPALDAAGFTTMRTFTGRKGYYITSARMMAPGGSDFTYAVARRVMDLACRIVRQAELPYVNGNVRVNGPGTTNPGTIDARDSGRFEATVNAQLAAALLNTSPQQASATSVVMSRTQNILSTNAEPVTVRVTPLGYLRSIPTSMGFNNPALALAA